MQRLTAAGSAATWALVAVLAAAGHESAAAPEPDPVDRTRHRAVAWMQDAAGAHVGTVRFTDLGDRVRIDASFVGLGLEPGFYGFHVHERGECDPEAPDGPFTTAGDHHAPGGATHPRHAGDLPPVVVGPDGRAQVSFTTHRLEIEELLAGDGTAVILHAQPDNLAHIPERYVSAEAGEPGPDEETLDTGDAGDRHACGVVRVARSSKEPGSTPARP